MKYMGKMAGKASELSTCLNPINITWSPKSKLQKKMNHAVAIYIEIQNMRNKCAFLVRDTFIYDTSLRKGTGMINTAFRIVVPLRGGEATWRVVLEGLHLNLKKKKVIF